jgi:hypothetical protein
MKDKSRTQYFNTYKHVIVITHTFFTVWMNTWLVRHTASSKEKIIDQITTASMRIH